MRQRNFDIMKLKFAPNDPPQALFTVAKDGTVSFGEHLTPSEGAEQAWAQLMAIKEAHNGEIERLRACVSDVRYALEMGIDVMPALARYGYEVGSEGAESMNETVEISRRRLAALVDHSTFAGPYLEIEQGSDRAVAWLAAMGSAKVALSDGETHEKEPKT